MDGSADLGLVLGVCNDHHRPAADQRVDQVREEAAVLLEPQDPKPCIAGRTCPSNVGRCVRERGGGDREGEGGRGRREVERDRPPCEQCGGRAMVGRAAQPDGAKRMPPGGTPSPTMDTCIVMGRPLPGVSANPAGHYG